MVDLVKADPRDLVGGSIAIQVPWISNSSPMLVLQELLRS